LIMSTLTEAGSTAAVTGDGMVADVVANVGCSPQEADDYRVGQFASTVGIVVGDRADLLAALDRGAPGSPGPTGRGRRRATPGHEC